MKTLAAYVLAGGRSSRMGKDKALLELGGKPLIVRALQVAGQITDDVAMVGDAAKLGVYGRVISDIFPGCGPLGGIHAALSASSADLNLMLAVDLPLLTPRLLEFLRGQAESSNAIVTVPVSEGRLHPLCAVYRREFAGLAEEALKAGRFRIDGLFQKAQARLVPEDELRANQFDRRLFRNLNTPEEWEQTAAEFSTPSAG